jgi:hypothetical protein
MRRVAVLVAGVSLLLTVSQAQAGRIVVNHDEWTTSNFGFIEAPADTAAFVQNVVSFLNLRGGPANVLAYSSNFSLRESGFVNALAAAGHSVTVGTEVALDLPTLLGYDAVFLAGSPAVDPSLLEAYVNAGGSVYLAAGTAAFGDVAGLSNESNAALEANVWNPFLNRFGLALRPERYNGLLGNFVVGGTHPIFDQVTSLYYQYGSSVVLSGNNPNAKIIEASVDGAGLIGVFDDTGPRQ